ncbi:hypothetical protein EFK50_12570 [Nocardioides marmoriginsengisoli]|uniref:DUF732 domain-containing protein n=1 Tax=Nocardioides marmoriginsengisoli TaxID=661483 RepID=A0A3N0CGK3_9ACTN|nr:hypothetical protein [Nocardioides marmoriginsengisoli]RNL62590.1 hypothetical protein EFK50_12570 [Nocardioides marmoriginsengisoli]
MKTMPRVLLLTVTALAVSSCGAESAPIPSPEDARTAACRGYVLQIGDDDLTLLKGMRDDASYGTSNDYSEGLGQVHAAAVTAGLAAGLSDADFQLFRVLAESTGAVGRAGPDQADGVKAITAFDKAVNAVHRRCS